MEDAKERVKAVKGNVVKCGKDVTYEISSVEKYSIVWENVETGEKFTITLKRRLRSSDEKVIRRCQRRIGWKIFERKEWTIMVPQWPLLET